LSYTFKDTHKEQSRESLRVLTSENVYCPKCGEVNNFSIATSDQTNFICQGCEVNIGDFWVAYKQKRLSVILCTYCNQPTFAIYRFCINCGSLKEQSELTQPRTIKIKVPKTKRHTVSTDKIETRIKTSLVFGAILSLIGLIIMMATFLEGGDTIFIVCLVLIGIGLIFMLLIPGLLFILLIFLKK